MLLDWYCQRAMLLLAAVLPVRIRYASLPLAAGHALGAWARQLLFSNANGLVDARPVASATIPPEWIFGTLNNSSLNWLFGWLEWQDWIAGCLDVWAFANPCARAFACVCQF